MTPIEMYWLIKLDDIVSICTMFAVIFSLLLPFIVIARQMEETFNKKLTSMILKVDIIGAVVFVPLAVFIPTTNQMRQILSLNDCNQIVLPVAPMVTTDCLENYGTDKK